MSRSLRRGVLAASLVLATASLSACAAGNDAASLEVRPDTPETSVAGMQIQNGVVIVSDGEDQPVAVTGTVVNNTSTAQTLESVKVKGMPTPFDLAGPDGEGGITVPAGSMVLIGGEGNASVSLPDVSDELKGALGHYRTVTFTFSDAGAVPLHATVVADEDYYAPFAGTPAPEPAAPVEAEQPAGDDKGADDAAADDEAGDKGADGKGTDDGATGEEPDAGASADPGADDADKGSDDEGAETGVPPADPDATQNPGGGEQH